MDESTVLIDTTSGGSYTVSTTTPCDDNRTRKTDKKNGVSQKRLFLLIFMAFAIVVVLFGDRILSWRGSGASHVHSHNELEQRDMAGRKEQELKREKEKGLRDDTPTKTTHNTDKSSSTESPNIIFLLMDDMGYSDMSARGSEFTTPNLDSLYEESIIVDSHYIGLVCSPSRSQIITGRYAWNMGISKQQAFGNVALIAFPSAIPTVADLLNEYSEYKSYFTGKWHMGYSTDDHCPLNRGWSKFYGFYTSNLKYSDKTISLPDYDDEYIDWRANDDIDYDTQYEHSTLVTGDKILDIINTHLSDDNTKNKPFYIHAPFQGFHNTLEEIDSDNMANCDLITTAYEISHTTEDGMSINLIYQNKEDYENDLLEAEEEEKEKEKADEETDIIEISDSDDSEDTTDYTDKNYYEFRLTMCHNILAFDSIVGDIIDNLKNTHDIWDNTIIIMSSDNGASYGFGGCNYPLRGTKDSYFDGGVRTLAFLSGGYISSQLDSNQNSDLRFNKDSSSKTTTVTSETRTNAFMHGSDWAPTILGFAGVDVDTVANDLQEKLYIPVAKQASLNEHDSEDYYENYLMSESFDGNDVSKWLLTGKNINGNNNPRINHVPLSINSIDTSMTADNGVNGDDLPEFENAIIFTSSITGHLYKFISLAEELKHGSRKCHYCTYRTVTETDEDDGSETELLQRTQTVGMFDTTNVFLFDLTLDEKESTNLFEVLATESDEDDEEEARRRRMNDVSFENVDDYDSDTVSSLWDEVVSLISNEYIENNPMFNDFLTCQTEGLADDADPSQFDGAFSPFYTWDEYTEQFNSLCSNDVNPVLSVMFTTKYGDY